MSTCAKEEGACLVTRSDPWTESLFLVKSNSFVTPTTLRVSVPFRLTGTSSGSPPTPTREDQTPYPLS